MYDRESVHGARRTSPHGAPWCTHGLLVFVAHRPVTGNEVAGNHFPTTSGLVELVEKASLEIGQWLGTAELPAPPKEWNECADTVDTALAERHGHTRAWQLAERQSTRIGNLLEDGTLTAELLVLRA